MTGRSTSFRRWLARNGIYLLVLLGFVLRIVLVVQAQALPIKWDEVAYVERAHLLLQDPAGYDDLLRPPAYPLFLAGTFQLVGESRFATGIVQALLATLLIAVMYAFARVLLQRRDVALVTAALTTFFPESITLARLFLSETLFILLSMLGFTLLLIAWRQRRVGVYFVAGVMIAAAALTRELLAYFSVVAIPVWVILAHNAGWRKLAAALAALLVGLALVFAPWVARNWALQGRIVLSTSHSEIDLLRDNLRIAIRADPPATESKISMKKQVRNILRDQPPEHRTTYVIARALDVMVNYPLPWIQDKFTRIHDFWAPSLIVFREIRLGAIHHPLYDWLQAWLSVAGIGLVLLSTLGLFMAQDDAPKLLIVFYILYSLVLFIMTHYFSRFRIPLLVLLLPYAALALLQLATWLRSPSRAPFTQHVARTVSASVVLVLFAILIFT